MLVLFDIDGTLLLTDRAGVRAMQEAGRALVGPGFSLERVDLAGRLDPSIWRDGLRAAGVVEHDGLQARFRMAYAALLEQRLRTQATARALPGVAALLERLRGRPGTTLGLLTGNYAETGALKLRAAGLEPDWFPVAAWGDDGEQRRDLPRVAMQRFAGLAGREAPPEQVVVIGDTPLDVDCARANGCRAVAVATGPSFTREELAAQGPDLLLDDLRDAERLFAWLGEVEGARARD